MEGFSVAAGSSIYKIQLSVPKVFLYNRLTLKD
jgi:hypothetical protein